MQVSSRKKMSLKKIDRCNLFLVVALAGVVLAVTGLMLAEAHFRSNSFSFFSPAASASRP